MQIELQTKYLFGTFERFWGTYSNGRLAMHIADAQTGDHALIATVNLPDEPQLDGEIFIKDWSENEGILQCLIQASVVHPPHRWISTGYVKAAVCNLRVNPAEED